MKKIDYIRLSHSGANRKIWNNITEKHVTLKQKSKLAGVLWIIVASPVFGCIAIFSWFSFLTMFFKDTRFTQHYMRTAIKAKDMTAEEASTYLDFCLSDYKNSLSYGNIPEREQKRIETTFELLFKELGIPEQDNNKGVASNIQELTQTVAESNNKLGTISTYTTWKHGIEREEVERKQQLQDEQAKRIISAHNRSKGRMLDSFESVLADDQLDILVNCCNNIRIFTRDIETFEMRDILACSHKEPLQVNVNKHLAILFDKLREHSLICMTWMSVAERRNCFVSKQGKPITSKDLSAALSTASLIKQEIEDGINEYMGVIMDSD